MKKIPKPLPQDDAEIYIGKIKKRASPTGEALQTLKDLRENELERIKSEAVVLEARKTLEDLKKGIRGGKEDSTLLLLLKDKSPEEIDKILSTMTPEKLENLKKLVQATDPINMAMNQPSSSSRDDFLLKYMLESNKMALQAALEAKSDKGKGSDIDGIITVLKIWKEMQPQSVPAVQSAPQQSSTNQAFELIKLMQEFNRPFYESLSRKDKEIFDLKMKELESKMPADPVEQIKYIKEMAGVLGLSGQHLSELDLKLEEMKQDREVDMKKLEWEQKKYEMEQDAEIAKWEQVGKILQGPIGETIKGIGNAGADRVRGGRGNPNPANMPKPVQTQCPNCGQVIFVDADANTAICGHCGAILQKAGAPATPVVQPPPVQPPPQPSQEEQVPIIQPEPEETKEEVEESGLTEADSESEEE